MHLKYFKDGLNLIIEELPCGIADCDAATILRLDKGYGASLVYDKVVEAVDLPCLGPDDRIAAQTCREQ